MQHLPRLPGAHPPRLRMPHPLLARTRHVPWLERGRHPSLFLMGRRRHHHGLPSPMAQLRSHPPLRPHGRRPGRPILTTGRRRRTPARSCRDLERPGISATNRNFSPAPQRPSRDQRRPGCPSHFTSSKYLRCCRDRRRPASTSNFIFSPRGRRATARRRPSRPLYKHPRGTWPSRDACRAHLLAAFGTRPVGPAHVRGLGVARLRGPAFRGSCHQNLPPTPGHQRPGLGSPPGLRRLPSPSPRHTAPLSLPSLAHRRNLARLDTGPPGARPRPPAHQVALVTRTMPAPAHPAHTARVPSPLDPHGSHGPPRLTRLHSVEQHGPPIPGHDVRLPPCTPRRRPLGLSHRLHGFSPRRLPLIRRPLLRHCNLRQPAWRAYSQLRTRLPRRPGCAHPLFRPRRPGGHSLVPLAATPLAAGSLHRHGHFTTRCPVCLPLPPLVYQTQKAAYQGRHVRLHVGRCLAPTPRPPRRHRGHGGRRPIANAKAAARPAPISQTKPLQLGTQRGRQNRTRAQVRHMDLAGHCRAGPAQLPPPALHRTTRCGRQSHRPVVAPHP